jgi:hypothetical protein
MSDVIINSIVDVLKNSDNFKKIDNAYTQFFVNAENNKNEENHSLIEITKEKKGKLYHMNMCVKFSKHCARIVLFKFSRCYMPKSHNLPIFSQKTRNPKLKSNAKTAIPESIAKIPINKLLNDVKTVIYQNQVSITFESCSYKYNKTGLVSYKINNSVTIQICKSDAHNHNNDIATAKTKEKKFIIEISTPHFEIIRL